MATDPFDDGPEYEETLDPFADDEALLEGIVAEEERGERVTAEASRTAESSQALTLAEPGLRGGLKTSQDLYARLGDVLQQRGLPRSSRNTAREARRILERSFGLDAVRMIPAKPTSAYARVQPPQLQQTAAGGYKGSPIAVHRFMRQQRRIRGGGSKPFYVPGDSFTGPTAYKDAVATHLADLSISLSNMKGQLEKLESGRGGVTVEARKRRLRANIEALTDEYNQYATASPSLASEPALLPAGDPREEAAKMARSGATSREITAMLAEKYNLGRERREILRELRASGLLK